MERDWIKIWTYSNPLYAELGKQLLEANDIPAVVLNKQDSSYKFGNIELYVVREMQDGALAILNEPNQEEE